jgi:hypothetical protein
VETGIKGKEKSTLLVVKCPALLYDKNCVAECNSSIALYNNYTIIAEK